MQQDRPGQAGIKAVMRQSWIMYITKQQQEFVLVRAACKVGAGNSQQFASDSVIGSDMAIGSGSGHGLDHRQSHIVRSRSLRSSCCTEMQLVPCCAVTGRMRNVLLLGCSRWCGFRFWGLIMSTGCLR